MNNMSSYCGLVDAKIGVSLNDLPVIFDMLTIPKVFLNWDVPYGDADVQYILCNFRKKAVQSQYKQHADKISNPPGFPYFQNLHDLSK